MAHYWCCCIRLLFTGQHFSESSLISESDRSGANSRQTSSIQVDHAEVGVGFVSSLQDLRLCFKNLSMLLDYLEILSMCVFQDRVFWRSTPSYNLAGSVVVYS